MAGVTLAGDAIVVLRLLPRAEAVGDLIVMGSAVGMLTAVLVTAGSHQARLVARLNALATADPLTGLATRRELENVAEGLLSGVSTVGRRPTRRGADDASVVALVLIDVDRFKVLNDTHGHPAGDAALVHVAQLVRAAVRPSDTVARFGGDELAVLLPASLEDARTRAEAVCETVRDTPFRVGESDVRITVSVGVAHAHAGAARFEDLYAAADAALYRAKVAGRDGVMASSA